MKKNPVGRINSCLHTEERINELDLDLTNYGLLGESGFWLVSVKPACKNGVFLLEDCFFF